jgi:hypothetical protein
LANGEQGGLFDRNFLKISQKIPYLDNVHDDRD